MERQNIKCVACWNEFEWTFKRTFPLWFRKIKCKKCSEYFLYPLTDLYRTIYLLLWIGLIFGIVKIIKYWWNPIYLILGFIAIIALIKDFLIRKKINNKFSIVSFKELLTIFKDDSYDSSTTESKVLEKIDSLLEKEAIDNIKTRDDFIRFLFKIYFYKRKYRPFISYLEIFYRYYLITLILISIIISFIWGLINNQDEFEFYRKLWILFSNVLYLSFFFYILIRLYVYIRKLIRHEIKKNIWKTILFWIIKIILFYIFIASTLSIWQLLSSFVNIIGISIEWIIYDLK